MFTNLTFFTRTAGGVFLVRTPMWPLMVWSRPSSHALIGAGIRCRLCSPTAVMLLSMFLSSLTVSPLLRFTQGLGQLGVLRAAYSAALCCPRPAAPILSSVLPP